MSSRQLVLAINATNALAIITSDSGSLPNTSVSPPLRARPQPRSVAGQDARTPLPTASSTPPHRQIVRGSQSGRWTGAIRPAVISTTNRSALMPSNQRRVPDSCLAEAAENSAAFDGLRICSDGFLKRGAFLPCLQFRGDRLDLAVMHDLQPAVPTSRRTTPVSSKPFRARRIIRSSDGQSIFGTA